MPFDLIFLEHIYIFPILHLYAIISALEFNKNSDERCSAHSDTGPCQYFQLKWYWDEKLNDCRQFNYGGCLGNRNRYNTKESCQRHCLFRIFDQNSIPAVCLLDADPGYCFNSRTEEKLQTLQTNGNEAEATIPKNAQWWYYFNAELGVCVKFLYYGCSAGNENRFYSLYQCRKVCGERLAPQIECDKCNIRTSYCKFYSKYNYSCECRDGYKKNNDGECIDRNECEESAKTHPLVCDLSNTICTNLLGSYRCDCKPGYVHKGEICVYVGIGTSSVGAKCDDCSEFATCQNGICQCKLGFIGDGLTCTDVDECLDFKIFYEMLNSTKNITTTTSLLLSTPVSTTLQPTPVTTKNNICDENARCKNTVGSFDCECNPGYAGNGRVCIRDSAACLDKFDPLYKTSCASTQYNNKPMSSGVQTNWRVYYYFERATKRCEMFWYSGCGRDTVLSRNIFAHLTSCQEMCELSNVQRSADSCLDNFDPTLWNQCGTGNWQARYYFDAESNQCRRFWWDGCRSEFSRNYFTDLLNCQWLCQQGGTLKESIWPLIQKNHPHRQHHLKTIYHDKNSIKVSKGRLSDACYDVFDEHYRDECGGGDWHRYFYFNQISKLCEAFWYDSCLGKSQNLFVEKRACVESCEEPTLRISNSIEKTTPKIVHEIVTIKPTSIKLGKLKTTTKVTEKPDSVNQNFTESKTTLKPKTIVKEISATKVFNKKFKYDFEKSNSTRLRAKPKKIDITNLQIEPTTLASDLEAKSISTKAEKNCDSKPCQNGGTCILAPKKLDSAIQPDVYECFCTTGFAGFYCEKKPCETEPCQNNGTCQTTRKQPLFFFCECTPEWGGKTCVIPISSTANREYGKNVSLLSSGRKEWIEQIQRMSLSNNSEIKQTKSYGDQLNIQDKQQLDPAGGKVVPINISVISPTRTLSEQSAVVDGAESHCTQLCLKLVAILFPNVFSANLYYHFFLH